MRRRDAARDHHRAWGDHRRRAPATGPADRALPGLTVDKESAIDPRLLHAQRLLQLGRPEQAAKLIGEYLTTEPDDALAVSWLAEAELEREHFDEAERHARRAIELAPDWAITWETLARVQLHRHNLVEAEAAARRAIELAPNDADGFGVLGAILLTRKAWIEAREAADAGLRVEPEHEGCVNVRAMALRQLGEHTAAQSTLAVQLSRNPLDADAHANQGWNHLHGGDYARAVEHFREALRLDAENDWAREGIKNALQARHWFYRPVLRFELWASRFETKKIAALMIGGYVLYRVAWSLAERTTTLAPLFWSIVAAYLVFVLASWFASPIAAALLSFHPLGRIAATRREKVEAWTVCGLLLMAITMVVAGLTRQQDSLARTGFALGLLCLPLKVTFDLPVRARRIMILFTAGVAIFGGWWLAIAIRADTYGTHLHAVRQEARALLEERDGGRPPASGAPSIDERILAFEREHAEELRQLLQRRLPMSGGTFGLCYAILCFWVSQIVGGIAAERAQRR